MPPTFLYIAPVDDDAPLREDELRELPVFPLPRVVFFPGSRVPLYLFEPRYRAMAQHCVEHGPRALALVRILPDHEGDWQGNPPVEAVAGAGRIVEHRKRRDGTHDMVLVGTDRVRLHELPELGLPFRRARAERLVDTGRIEVQDDATRALMSCATALGAWIRRKHPDFELRLDPRESPAQLADRLADCFVADPDKRQSILEMLDVSLRVHAVSATLSELMLHVLPHGPSGLSH